MDWLVFWRLKPLSWLAGFDFVIASLPDVLGTVLYAFSFNNPPFVPASCWAGVEGWQGSDPSITEIFVLRE